MDEVMELKDIITIYVPSLCRHEFLRRVLDYYSESGITVLISDDTNTPLPGVDQYPNVIYCQNDLPYAQSVAEPGLEHINTKYVLTPADDIIIPLSAIQKCVDFLEAHPDYAAAQGYQASMYYTGNGYRLKIGPQSDQDVAGELPSDRLLKYIGGPHRFYFGVWRSDAWKKLYTEIPLEVLNEPRGINCEIVIYFLMAMIGKLKRLPIFFALHEDVPCIHKKLRKNFSHWEFATLPEHAQALSKFIEHGASILQKFEPMDHDEALFYARRVFEIYGLGDRGEIGKKTICYRIKRELRSAWNKTLGKKAFQQKKKRQAEEREALNNKRLAAMTAECREEMEKAAEFVFNYPRCKNGPYN